MKMFAKQPNIFGAQPFPKSWICHWALKIVHDPYFNTPIVIVDSPHSYILPLCLIGYDGLPIHCSGGGGIGEENIDKVMHLRM